MTTAIAYLQLAFTDIVLTGDFPGFAATGVEEDHPLVILALAIHQVLVVAGVL